MICVFEDFDYSRVGQMQSLLESHGIRTFLKNQFGFGGTGELPFVETVPQLYVLADDDEARAREILADHAGSTNVGKPWVCGSCGTEVEGNFVQCWNCGATAEKG
jgi:rubrerythrin